MTDHSSAVRVRRSLLTRAALAIALVASILAVAPVPFSEAMRGAGSMAWQLGCPTVRDGDLLQADGPEILLVEAGRVRWIPDFATFRALGFDLGAVDPIPAACLAALPKGPPLPSLAGPPAPPGATTPGTAPRPGPGELAPSGALIDEGLHLRASATEAPLGALITLTATLDAPGAGDYSLTIQRLRQPGGPSGGLVATCRSAPTCSGQARVTQPGSVSFLATLYRCDPRDVCTAERSSATVTVTWR